jgi:multicomponent Na+:H+ antiporter subunit B
VTREARLRLFMLGAGGLAVVLGFGLAGLSGYDAHLGPYAQYIATNAVSQRQAANTVISVTFDYRALDTLAEEFMIFVAAVGTAVLLRAQRGEREERRSAELDEQRGRETSDILRATGVGLAPVTVLLAVYIVTHGQLSPGGGFQGGVILAAALVFVYVAGQYVLLRRVSPEPALEVAEASGAAGFALLGLGGLLFGATFFENFLPFGTKGSLLSGGTIPLSNLAVGLEVAGALGLIVSEFLDQMVLRRDGGR